MPRIRSYLALVFGLVTCGCTYYGAPRGTGQFVLDSSSGVPLVYVVPTRAFSAAFTDRAAEHRSTLEPRLAELGSAFQPQGQLVRYAPGSYMLIFFCGEYIQTRILQLEHATSPAMVSRVDATCGT